MNKQAHNAPFTAEEIEFFASCGVDVARRQRLEEIAARQRARNPLRWALRQLVRVLPAGMGVRLERFC